MKYDTVVKNLHDYRDGAITDTASFQSKLQGEAKQSMQMILSGNTTKIRDDLDITIIDHDIRLKATAADTKQEISRLN